MHGLVSARASQGARGKPIDGSGKASVSDDDDWPRFLGDLRDQLLAKRLAQVHARAQGFSDCRRNGTKYNDRRTGQAQRCQSRLADRCHGRAENIGAAVAMYSYEYKIPVYNRT